MPLYIKGRSLFISTSLCASLGDVRFHGLQDSLLGHYIINSILRIYVPSTLNMAVQLTKFLIVTLDLTPNISNQPTFHHQVHYLFRIKS